MDFLDEKEFIFNIESKQIKLNSIYNELVEIQNKLKAAKDANDTIEIYEYLYTKEFHLIIQLSGAYDDLDRMLSRLYKEIPEQRFFINRVRNDIKQYKIWETIEI